MSDKRVEKAGLQIGEELHRVLVDEALPGTGVDPGSFFEGLARLVADLGPRNGRTAGGAGAPPGRDRWLAPGSVRRAPRRRRLPGLPGGGRLPGPTGPRFHDRGDRRRSRDRHDSRPATRGAGHERTVRAQRGERPVGFAVRRALRHRRDGRRPAPRSVRPGAGRSGHRLGSRPARRAPPPRRRFPHRGDRLSRRRRPPRGGAGRRRADHPWPTQHGCRGSPDQPTNRRACCSTTTASASRS